MFIGCEVKTCVVVYQSLEQRAKERVRRGIVGVDEQVSYLEKVIKTEHNLNEWRVKFDSSRLSLMVFCKDGERGG
jgi:hypothetical protein